MTEYDAVVVGARCAGSATAMLLARAGMRVLLLDRTHPGQDTLSTHALMRAGVVQLDRWGVLPRIVEAGTPPVTATTFHYADRAETVALAAPLYAPRRRCSTPRCWPRRSRRGSRPASGRTSPTWSATAPAG